MLAAVEKGATLERKPSGLRYLVPIHLDDLDNPHTLAILSTPPGSRVLDLGCGPGVVAEALAKRGCAVSGIDADPAAADLARKHCRSVVVADLEEVDPAKAFPGERFDVVLLLDVLEHLRNPALVLRRVAALMNPGGIVLASIPNVAHGAVRLALLSGKFRYSEKGLLDRDHLRFFEASTVDDLFRETGYSIHSRLRVVRDLDQTEIHLDLDAYPESLLNELRNDPVALTYQFFVIASPLASLRALVAKRGPEPMLAERLQARVAELEKWLRQTKPQLQQAGCWHDRLEEQEALVAVLRDEVERRQALIEAMERSKLWRLRSFLRAALPLGRH